VSIRRNPSRLASSAAAVDLPAPAGPSIVITGSRPSIRFTLRRSLDAPRGAPRRSSAPQTGSRDLIPHALEPRELLLERLVITGFDEPLEVIECAAKRADGLDQRASVLAEDLAPHLGASSGNARRIAKSRAGDVQELRIHPQHGIDQRVGHEMREMA